MKYFKTIALFIMIFFLQGFIIYSAPDNQPPGDLNLAHSGLQGSGNCSSCHTAENIVDAKKCLACHHEILKRIELSTGYHAGKSEDCQLCHAEHQGEDSKLIEFDPQDFDHRETGFTIDGSHKKISDCGKCHTGKNSVTRKFFSSFLIHSRNCSACHKDVHNRMYPACEECHSTDDWSVE